MKTPCCATLSLLFYSASFAQGNNCATAIPLMIDGVCRTYNFSSTTESSVANCLYPGNGPVLYFVFNTAAGDPPPCINVETSLSTPAVLEASIKRADCSEMFTYHQTVCFNDGNGYWAIDNSYGAGQLQGSSTYFLRYRVAQGFSGQITVCAQKPEPENLKCQETIPITNVPTWYENSCHQGDTIPAGDVCANTLENTAWYSYTIQGTEQDVLNISAINCDNFEADYYGYQVGIFTGDCSNLVSYGPCFADLGGSLQFPLTSLSPGTNIFIAIDGKGSSNCRYLMWAGLSQPLPVKWGHVAGKALSNGNLIQWTTLQEINTSHFEIERSDDGIFFTRIASVSTIGNYPKEKEYSFVDALLNAESWYRIKLIDVDERASYSRIIKIERISLQQIRVSMRNPAREMAMINIDSKIHDNGHLLVMNNHGQVVARKKIEVRPGQQQFAIPLFPHPLGVYYLKCELTSYSESIAFLLQ